MLLYRKFHPVISIFAVVLVMASLLALTNSFACTKLEFQQDQQTLEILIGVFPEAGYYIYDEEAEIYNVYDMSKNQTGYAFYGSSRGFISSIYVLVGLEDKETIRGIVVTSQDESYIRWNMLVKYSFFDQFIGLKIEDCYPSWSWLPGGVNAITGATISSKGVVNAVREAALEKIEYLD